MAIVKIILAALITAIITLYLKKYNPELSLLASVAGGLIVIFLTADYIFGIAEYVKEFFSASGIDSDLLKIVIKITVLAYIIEFAAGTVRDFGESGLAEKVILAGKIIILSMSFPIIQSLFSLITRLINK